MPDKRLIDANALKWNLNVENAVKYGNETPEQLHNSYGTMMRYEIADYIDDAPTIDAVEVVRCKDCKYAIVNENHIDKPLICCKTKMVGTTDPDWFCADGKRRMDGGAEG